MTRGGSEGAGATSDFGLSGTLDVSLEEAAATAAVPHRAQNLSPGKIT